MRLAAKVVVVRKTGGAEGSSRVRIPDLPPLLACITMVWINIFQVSYLLARPRLHLGPRLYGNIADIVCFHLHRIWFHAAYVDSESGSVRRAKRKSVLLFM